MKRLCFQRRRTTTFEMGLRPRRRSWSSTVSMGTTSMLRCRMTTLLSLNGRMAPPSLATDRGTDALEDVVPDIQILLGRHSPFAHRLTALRSGTHITDRFEAADRKYQHAAEKYTPQRIAYLTGHSLGGTQAIATARRRGLVSHAFNPGSSPFVEMIHAGVCSLADCDERPQSIYTTTPLAPTPSLLVPTSLIPLQTTW